MSLAPSKCPECPYSKSRNLGTHLFFVHGYSKERISEWRMNVRSDILTSSRDVFDIFRCRFCPKTYKRQNSCRAHERVIHCVTSTQRHKCVPCPIRNCTFTTTALLDLCAHAGERHAELGDFSIREERFENMSLFQAWRLQYEESTSSMLATESVNANAAAGTTLRYMRCAQLEAQMRRVRSQLKAEGGEGEEEMLSERALVDYAEDDGEEEMDEEEEEELQRQQPAAPAATPSTPRRSARKRAHVRSDDEEEGEEAVDTVEGELKKATKEEDEDAKGEQSKKVKKAAGPEDEAEGEPEEEEEEVDVEQVDEEALKKPFGAAARGVQPVRRRKQQLQQQQDEGADGKAGDDALPVLQDESTAPHEPRMEAGADAQPPAGDMQKLEALRAREERGASARAAADEAELERRMHSRHCTAHMRVLVLQSGLVHVEYCGTHLGHEIAPAPQQPPARASLDRRSERQLQQLQQMKAEEGEGEVEGGQQQLQQLRKMGRMASATDADHAIAEAKQRRKGRRETEVRWRQERRLRSERDAFMQLCDRFDDIGANVELYEAPPDEGYEEAVEVLDVEEVIEDEDAAAAAMAADVKDEQEEGEDEEEEPEEDSRG